MFRGLEATDALAALDLHAGGERKSGEDALEMLHFATNCVPAGAGSRDVHLDESMWP
jgi:hypothetical protein